MAKLLKIVAKLVGGTLEWILILFIVFAFAIRTSPVQTYLANLATDFLSKEMNTTFRIDAVDIVFIDRVDLKGVLVLDEKSDTLANIHSLLVNVSGLSAFQRKIHIDDVTLDGGVVKINRDSLTGDYNYWFIQDYFDSGKEKTPSDPLPLTVDDIHISNLRFHYDDNRKGRNDFGMDYDHLKFSNVHLSLLGLKIENEVITGKITDFGASESCGFDLTKFQSLVYLSPNGMALKDVSIKTPNSEIHSNDFKFLYSGYTDFREFVDSVAFDVKLQPSTISLLDVSYFGTALEGMDQVAQFTGNVSKKVKNLKVSDFKLTTGNRTRLHGTLNLPDFRALESAFYQERLDYAYIDIKDIESLKLPVSSEKRYIDLDDNLKRMEYFEAKDVRLDGIYSQFVVSTDVIETAIGSANLDNGILFQRNEANNSFFFKRSQAGEYDVKVNQFRLDKFLNNDLYGEVDGTFFLSGEAFGFSDIHFMSIEGDINTFDLADYRYSEIHVDQASFIDKVIIAEATVSDNNLNLNYSGTIDLNGEPSMKMVINLEKALLSKLKITEADSTSFISKINLNVVGLDPNKMRGNVTLTEMEYKEGNRVITIPSLTMDVNRSQESDVFDIKSSLANAKVEGKIDFNNIVPNFQEQFSQIFPGLYQFKDTRKKYNGSRDHFVYSITTGDLVDFLEVFVPGLQVAPGTVVKGSYDGVSKDFDMELTSMNIQYEEKVLKDVKINQEIHAKNLEADYTIGYFALNDSITIQKVHFVSNGNGDDLYSKLTWNPETLNETAIQWRTHIESARNMDFALEPSYFSLNEKRWDISQESSIHLDSTNLVVQGFRLSRNDQYIDVNGKISNNDTDKLKFELNEVDLDELSVLAGLSTPISGKLNGWGYITNPYENLAYMGDLNLQSFQVDGEEVGDVFVMSNWNKETNTIKLEGELMYKGIQSLDFEGNYFVDKEEDNLDFNLKFDETNIAFTNAFMDPDVISNIRGFVNGTLNVKGTAARPIIEGSVQLDNASAKIELLGTTFSMNGAMKADADGFYIDNMPVSDAEGNTGSLIGSIYHDDYADWNFDVAINLEDDAKNINRLQPWKPYPLQKFLVMNTEYKLGELYYGKAYATGMVEIFGYADNLEISVDVKTEKGTWINFPMYGSGELEEGEDFITFISKDSVIADLEKKIDFTGVDLDLNFNVTDDAQLKIIFNEQLGDEIIANGYGNLGIQLNQLGDISMEGTYVISDGRYNFAMGPVKQTFYIVPGGSITWTGNPYEANLNLSTYYKVKTSFAELSSDQTGSGLQEIQCYLNLTESLMKPKIDFDIKAPKADESGKALLSRVTSDKDELNRQFFSLLLTKNFLPLKGSTKAGGGAALDLVSSQINALLDQVSQGYKLNVDLSSDNIDGNEVAFGISKGFLDDRLTVTGSFGVENNTSGEQSKSSLIGDLEVEYKLNESGTFRVNVFNESNDNSILQSQNQGRFTQGAGVHYREDFNTTKDFMVIQRFFDIFRKKANKRYPIRRKKQQTPVPKDGVLEKKTLESTEDNQKSNDN